MPTEPVTQERSPAGIGYGIGAYLLWGLFPAYWPLLAPAGAVEVLAHRIAWTLAVMLVAATVLRRWRVLRALSPRRWALVATAAALITVNWGVYIYGVDNGHVIETALGYFINPLLSVLLGVFVLRERLRRTQVVALAIAGCAVVVITIDYGRVPVIALTLAFAFALYGLIKKTVPLDTASSLTAESLVLGPFAIGYLVWLGVTGPGTFGHGVGHSWLLISAGPATAVPLLLFGAAAKRIPLTTVGTLQYLTPVLQFLWGLLVSHEPMPASRWIGFALVWTGLLIFAVDALHTAHRSRPRECETTL